MTSTPPPKDAQAEHLHRRLRNLATRINQLDPRRPEHAQAITTLHATLNPKHGD